MTNQHKSMKGKVEVLISNAIKIIVDVEDENEFVDIISRLAKIKGQLMKFDKTFGQEQPVVDTSLFKRQIIAPCEEGPYEKVANMLDNVTADKLRTVKIFSIKGENVQLLKPNQFKKVMDAICVLLFILEVGVGKRDLQYDIFRDIFESQNIKSGSPLTMLMTNMKGAKYIDARKYKAKIVSLSPKGQEQAITVLNKFFKI